jgi:hypothetical protein
VTAAAESFARGTGFRSSAMKRPLQLHFAGTRLTVDPDGAVRSLCSLEEGRALFGFEQLWFYKVQAGVVVPGQRPDWELRLSTRRARLTGRVFDVEVAQSIEFHPRTPGFVRRVAAKNAGNAEVRLRVIGLLDPTAAHFPDPSASWGALGVNAFNRESHVAMDEVSDPPSARVAGSYPAPSRFYMTASRQRAQEVVAAGELPEATAGTSGQVVVLSSHELDLPPGGSRDLTFAFIYNPGRLEEALSDFGRLREEEGGGGSGPEVLCSDPAVAEAAAWALASVQSAPFAEDPLDRYESLRALTMLFPPLAARVVADAKGSLRKDGALPHSVGCSKPGPLETAVFLRAHALSVVWAQDKKQAKAAYPTVRKCAAYLMSAGVECASDPSVPQGWRRRLGSGYPAGEVPEVALAAASALEAASAAARLASKGDDAGRFLERSKLITDHVRRSLLDERGFVSLCRGTGGRLRGDETVDMAVAAYRHPFKESAEQAAAHRLTEKDFDTPYGPRCVPTSNAVYFNSTYGEGQLGGVWPRASLAHALLCYRAGVPGLGSLSLTKTARLVVEWQLRLGGVPGEFPLWVDPDRRESHGGPDPVAAARFLETLLEGELGVPGGAGRGPLSPAQSSTIPWLLASDFWAGGPSTVFVGRGGGRAHLFYSGGRLDPAPGTKFEGSERLAPPQHGVCAVSFHGPGQVVCVGSALGSPSRFTVAFPPRAPDLAKRLSAQLEEYDPAKGGWAKVGSVRVSQSIGFEGSLPPGGWKAYRVSTG